MGLTHIAYNVINFNPKFQSKQQGFFPTKHIFTTVPNNKAVHNNNKLFKKLIHLSIKARPHCLVR